ncbi:MAG TPA: nucleotidyltransferase family protein [Stellaceae bacterium]|jgi:hypothetical protein
MQLAPEFRLLCLALRRPFPAADMRRLAAAEAERLNWAAIVEGARSHRVSALVLEGFQDGGVAVPDPAVAELGRHAHVSARRALAQGALISRLLRLLTDAGIRVLTLKGIVLSAQLYGDPARRSAADIDLLIDPVQFERAAALLVAAGYRPKGHDNLSPRQRTAYRYWIKDVVLVDAVSGTPIELHHRLTDNPELLCAHFDTLWRERDEVAVWGVTAATLGRRYLPLYLCAHGAVHGWDRLRWLIDLADALEGPEMAATRTAAQAAGLDAALLHAVSLAHDWLGMAVAPGILEELRRSPAVCRLDRIHARLYAGEAWQQTLRRDLPATLRRQTYWQMRYRLRLKSDWRYRRRQVLRELVSPADWGTVALPDRLFFLYPLIRPIGWLIRRLRR